MSIFNAEIDELYRKIFVILKFIWYQKAFDCYPFEIETVVENLNYALSYDTDHAQANCLMGCVQMYVLKNFKLAKTYFDQALVGSLDYPDTYKNYALLLIWLGEFESALKLIKYGLKIPGMDKRTLLSREAMIQEMRGNFVDAKSILKASKVYSLDEDTTKRIEKEITRLKQKMKEHKQKKVSAKVQRAK